MIITVILYYMLSTRRVPYNPLPDLPVDKYRCNSDDADDQTDAQYGDLKGVI